MIIQGNRRPQHRQPRCRNPVLHRHHNRHLQPVGAQHTRHRTAPPRARQRHRQAVELLTHDRPDRRNTVGSLQRRHRIPRPHRAGPGSAHRQRRQRSPRTAQHHHRRNQRIAQSPSLPAAANPVNGRCPKWARPAPHHRGLAGPPFFPPASPRRRRPRGRRASPSRPHLPTRTTRAPRRPSPPCHSASPRPHQAHASASLSTAPTPLARGTNEPPSLRPHRGRGRRAPRPPHHRVGSRDPNSAASTATASHPLRTASRSATARARRAFTPLSLRRMATRPPPRPARAIISMLSRWVPGITCSRTGSAVKLTRTHAMLLQPCSARTHGSNGFPPSAAANA
jgi:hypothetical protein